MIVNKTYLNLLLVFVLGAISVLGFAPYYLFPIPIIAIAVLSYVWFIASTPKAAWVLGFSYGLGLYCVGIYWIYISLHDFGGMPWWFAGFCTFCLCAFMALFVGAVGYFSKRCGFLWLSIPVLWGLSDWVRSWIFTGFPWLTMGYSQVPHSPLAGYLPMVGVYGVSVLTVLVASLSMVIFVYVYQQPKSGNTKTIRNAIVGITLILVAGLLLKAVEWSSPIGKPITVALLQGNIAQDEKWSPASTQSSIDLYLNMAQQSRAQLTILPETALPVVASQLDASITQTLQNIAAQNKGGVIVGMVEYIEASQQYFNSALCFGCAQNTAYRKNHLVPFGEFIPLKQIFGWIYRDWLNIPLSDLSRGGSTQANMQVAGQSVAMNICYEDVFGEEIAHNTKNSSLLVNISNDAWYGQSYAAYQHMQFSQARAIENARYMLRATNTGATAAIDQHGQVLAHAPHFSNTVLNINAQGFTGRTPYIVVGNWPFIAFSLIALFGIMFRQKNSTKTRERN